jgi:hypothetical protein
LSAAKKKSFIRLTPGWFPSVADYSKPRDRRPTARP